MPRKERGDRVPENIAWHGFNNKHAVPATEEIDIIHTCDALFLPGMLDYAEMGKLATRLNALMDGKIFEAQGQRYTVVKVFHAGEGCVRMRCEVVTLPQSSEIDTEAC